MAKRDIPKIAQEVIAGVGGAKNIDSIDHCSTRLRIYLNDKSKADSSKLNDIDEVVGIDDSTNQYQVVIGTYVEEVCDEIKNEIGAGSGKAPAKEKVSLNPLKLIGKFMELLARIFAPIVPALSVAGFVKVIQILLQLTGVITAQSSTYLILNTLTDAVFYFLPVYLAITSAKLFGTNEILAVVLACLILHPEMTTLMASHKALTLFAIPVIKTTYSSSVVPIILSVWIMSKLDKWLNKIIPEFLKNFLKPLSLVLIMAVILLTVTGPLGQVLSNWISVGVQWLSNNAGAIAVPIITAVGPLISMGGMHLALVPLAVQSIAQVGYDKIINVWFLCNTVASGGVALAVFLKTKKNKLKNVAGPAALAGLFGGISEPSLYGIEYKMKKPFVAKIIGATVAAVYAGFTGLKAYAFGGYSLTALAVYYGNAHNVTNFTNACITAGISIAVSFIMTWILGFDDSSFAEKENNEQTENETTEIKSEELGAVAQGTYVPMKDIADKVFSEGTLGQAYGVISDDGKIYSPCDGKVTMVFKTKHAIGITSFDGAEILIHVGIDSVNLNGKGITNFVKEGQEVKKGDLVAEYDKQVFAENHIDDTTIVAITNTDKYQSINFMPQADKLSVGQDVIAMKG
ncbi:beta-glucoside-specific PTS transporter subunit IIABC [Lactobacillus sp. ESL0791]|uniref:beta-glucoside-specific PTS transporter subunit IIABC n=1 Tax=Lactobacillus sp. ESL0791 TaxID=2983234 RepID=UPI0023F95634|nr:beta-glucoside-specific PTS transporter subunit IIABC [Lactobacillus sp. ESL0791]MDF7639264.1 beta-glucoside-specific PTS transporter subunit IIABC [Lactobacillus sp. ESL0791]